jgi:ketosteroid isomerase-like protein
MATDDIAIVERLLAAYNRADAEAALVLLHEDVEFRSVAASAGGGPRVYRGHDGIRAYFADIAALWEEMVVTPVRLSTAGDAVVVLGRVYARGPAGIVDSPASWVWKVRDGRVLSGQVFADERAALAALGLTAGA